MADTVMFNTGSEARLNRRRQIMWTGEDTGYVNTAQNAPNDSGCTLYKTTDGFATAPTEIDPDWFRGTGGASWDGHARDCYYDGWSGHDGGLIHFVMHRTTGDDRILYQNFDTSDDTYTPELIGTFPFGDVYYQATHRVWQYNISVARSVDGRIYVLWKNHQTNLFAASDDDGATWTAKGVPGNSDHGMYELWPASGTGDDQDMVMIEHDYSDENIYISFYDASANSWSTRLQINDTSGSIERVTNYDSNANRHYPIQATYDPDNDRLWVVAMTQWDNAAADMHIYKIDVSTNPPTIDAASDLGSPTLEAVYTDQAESGYPGITLVQSTGDLYAWFQEAATIHSSSGGGDIFYKKSTDNGVNWGSAVDVSFSYGDIDFLATCPLIQTAVGGRVMPLWHADNTGGGTYVNKWMANEAYSVSIAAAAAGGFVPYPQPRGEFAGMLPLSGGIN